VPYSGLKPNWLSLLVLRSESPSGMCAKLRTASQSLYYCLFAPHIFDVVLRAHPVRGESRNQRNANGEVATLATNAQVPWFEYNCCKRNKSVTANITYVQGFLRCFRNPNRVPRIENRVSRISKNYHRAPTIRENRVPRIREIGPCRSTQGT